MGNRYKLSEAAAAVEPQILEALQHGAMAVEDLAAQIDLPPGKDRKFLKNQLTRLRMAGQIKYSMATGWSLDDGAPPAPRQPPAAGTVASGPAPRRDTTTDAPSRQAPPPKRETSAISPPPTPPDPGDAARKIAAMRWSGTPTDVTEDQDEEDATPETNEVPETQPEERDPDPGEGDLPDEIRTAPARLSVTMRIPPVDGEELRESVRDSARSIRRQTTAAFGPPEQGNGVAHEISATQGRIEFSTSLSLGPEDLVALGDEVGKVLWAMGILGKVPALLAETAEQDGEA